MNLSWWTLGVTVVTVFSTLTAVTVHRISGRGLTAAWCGASMWIALMVVSVMIAAGVTQSEGAIGDLAAKIMTLAGLCGLMWLWGGRKPRA